MKKQRVIQNEEILELIAKGKTQTEIGQILGVTQSTISKIIGKIDKEKVEKAREEARKSRIEDEEIILELIAKGKKQTEIARMLGGTDFTISTRIRKIDKDKVEKAREKGREEAKEKEKEAREAEEKELLKYIRQGKTQKEIARMLGVTDSTISTKIRKIDKDKVEKAREEARKARIKDEEIMLELIAKGKTQKEIAKKLGVSQKTICLRINKIDKDKIEEAKEEARKSRIEDKEVLKLTDEGKTDEEIMLELIAKGKTQKEIGKILGVSEMKILRKIRKIDKDKIEEAKGKAKEQEEKELLEYIRQGKKQTEIAKKIGVSYFTISRRINKMDKDKIEEAKGEERDQEEKELLEYIRQGKIQTEIAQILGVSDYTISTKIRKIDKEKVEKAREEAREAEEKELLEYIKQGKSQTEIAQILGVSDYTISTKIRKIDKEKVEKARKKEKEEAKENDERSLDEQLKIIVKKLNDRTLTKKDVLTFREELEKKRKVSMKEINLMVRIYIKTMQTNKAIEFINLMIRRDIDERTDILVEARNKVEYIQKMQTIRKCLQDGLKTNAIAERLGMNESDVIRIKKQIEAKKEKEI